MTEGFEFGIRPPAHRGLRLHPGGNAERKDMVHRAQGIGLKPRAGCQVSDELDFGFRNAE